jgi:hypothetical protein
MMERKNIGTRWIDEQTSRFNLCFFRIPLLQIGVLALISLERDGEEKTFHS